MANVYAGIYIHCVFSTKKRQKLIDRAIQERLWAYVAGICGRQGLEAKAVGGVEDHVHLLLNLNTRTPVSKAMQIIKGNSSKWLGEAFPRRNRFEWQSGYGAFSVSIDDVSRTRLYILNQVQHHRRMTFKEEYLALLRKHGAEIDSRYVLG